MRITDRFRGEHQVFLTQLDVLRGLLDGGASADAFAGALRALAAPVGGHAEREEAVLFPALGSEGIEAPTRVLTEEHRLFDGWIEQMTAGARAELRSVFEVFERTLRDHIAREDDVLFPLADRVLGEDRLVALDEAALGVRA